MHLEGLAQKHFSIQTLRPQQREVFTSLGQHNQVLAMLPTGAGKTLIYALGSLLFNDSVTIVVCPLIALMRDQYQRMVAAGISTALIYSEQPDEERRASFKSLLSGQTKLLFVSPERFALVGFQRFLRRLRLGMVVIDEAHCVVSWGHSFRPEYSQLGTILKGLGARKILALTATASRSSRVLIREMVFPEPEQVHEVVDRPLRENISVEALRVYSEEERWLAVQGLLAETKSHKTILYFPRREQCQNAAIELKKKGFNAVVYHAGLQRDFRRSVEEYLRQSERPVVICATLAFGMGIDLPDVQLIVVAGFPGNIEEMFQMMGRAGRQGEKSRAVIVWSGSDPKRRTFQFDKMLPEPPIVSERLQAISHFFPGNNQARLVPRKEIEKAMRAFVKEGRDLDQSVETLSGLLSMLGCGGGLESARSAWLNLEIKNTAAISVLTSALPIGPSRRRLVLEWLSQRLNLEETAKGKFYAAVPVSEIVEELQMNWDKIAEVFRYYSEQSELVYSVSPQEEVKGSLLFLGHLKEAFVRLPRYNRWRATLNQSLQALSTFVMADQCRMTGAENLFIGRGVGATSAARVRCGRCDLCERRLGRGLQSLREQHAGALTATLPDHLR